MTTHKWYRIEMTATGQVYAREVDIPLLDDPLVGSATWDRPLVLENVGRYTCSCCVGYL